MFRIVLTALFVLSSAAWAQGPGDGPAGPPGPQVPPGHQLPRICAPATRFCEGNQLWSCTRSGADAVLVEECAGGSATNPMGCFQTGCGSNAGACCRPVKTLCRVEFTSPAASGSSNSAPAGAQCSAPTAPSCPGEGAFAFTVTPPAPLTCGGAPYVRFVSVSITRALVSPGRTYTLPVPGISIAQFGSDASRQCFSWTGTVTWDSDVPSWRFSIDATCSEPGKSGVRLVGTTSGDI